MTDRTTPPTGRRRSSGLPEYCLLLGLLNGSAAQPVFAESSETLPHQAGRALGEFSQGVAKPITDQWQQNILDIQGHWETVPPRSKEECLQDSQGVINEYFVRCRNGYQQRVRVRPNGERVVVQERAIGG